MLVGHVGGEHVLDLDREAGVLTDYATGTIGLGLGGRTTGRTGRTRTKYRMRTRQIIRSEVNE